MTVGAILSNGRLSVCAGNKTYQILESDERFNRVIKLLNSGATEQSIVNALDIVKHIKHITAKAGLGKVTIEGDQVLFDGKVSCNFIAKRIIEHAKNNLPFKPLMKCLERLMNNPSYNSREQFGKFMEHKSLPVTEDGMVLAYKAITNDWKDKHTKTIDNRIGAEITMDRALIDDNPNSACSKGLHVGALEYVRNFAQGDDRIVIVMLDPADSVSVPTDANFTKMRVCKYKVISEFKEELNNNLYKNDASEYDNSISDDDYYDEDDVQSSYDDEEEDLDDAVCMDDIIPDNGKCCRGDCGTASCGNLGVKPNGQNYHNVRNKLGRFAKK